MRFGLHDNYWAALLAVGVSASFLAGCGDDDNSSGGGSTTCPDGECETDCPQGQTLCDDACSTLDTDRANCGECGNSCGAGQICSEGECVISCPKGQVLCDGECINPDTSREYCGASGSCRGSKAGDSCEAGSVCEAGSCVASCSPGLTECNGGCVDLDNDPDHCGTCETSCDYANATGICVAGSCGGFVACAPGYADCDGREANGCEINVEEDRRHCGACDNRCGLTDTCDDGECKNGTALGDNYRVSLGTTCSIVDHDSTTGDDRGGVAVTTDAFYVTGDNATARISLDLKKQVALDRVMDGIVTDLATGTLYEVGTDSTSHVRGDSTISAIHRLASDGAIEDTVLLDTPISVNSGSNGVFAGPGFMMLYSGADYRLYRIDFATGAVTDLGDDVSLDFWGCENWAAWGFVELHGGTPHLVYSGSGGVLRTSLADGETETVLAGNFSDMCSLTFSPHQSRWYFHYEGGGQFGGNYETAGYCNADWVTGDCIDTADLTKDEKNCGACGNECGSGEQCNDGVCDACEVFGATECKGKCVDLQWDAKNCGACGNKCGGDTPYCVEGACGTATPSCKEVTGDSGVYTLAPSGSAPFQAYCEQSDMAGHGGGWTLLAVFSNADGEVNWTPRGGAWVTSSTFGTPTDPTVNADAKSPAFNVLNVDELMIVQDGEVHVLTDTSCVGNQSLRSLFSRSSETDANCAHECATVIQTGPWNTQDYQTSGLRFRCSDYIDVTDEGGYGLSSDDNSFITTLDNYNYMDYNFGLGAGQSGDFVDWDSTTSDFGDNSDTTPVLLFGR